MSRNLISWLQLWTGYAIWDIVHKVIIFPAYKSFSKYFQVQGRELYAQRAILVCASPHFFELCSTEGNGQQLDSKHHYVIPNVDYESFTILLNYIYTAR